MENLLHKVLRYKALLVAPEEEGYFLRVSTYLHLNPARARLVRAGEEPLEAFRWSSYPEYLKPPRKRPGMLEVGRVLDELCLEDKASGRREYGRYMEERRADLGCAQGRKELESEWKEIRRGWCLGSDRFRERMQEMVDASLLGKRRDSFSGAARRAHDEAAACQLLATGLQALELSASDLRALSKSDLRKQVLAWWVRKQTAVSNRWVSEHLDTGYAGNVSKMVRAVETNALRGATRLKKRVRQEAQIPKHED